MYSGVLYSLSSGPSNLLPKGGGQVSQPQEIKLRWTEKCSQQQEADFVEEILPRFSRSATKHPLSLSLECLVAFKLRGCLLVFSFVGTEEV